MNFKQINVLEHTTLNAQRNDYIVLTITTVDMMNSVACKYIPINYTVDIK